MQPGELPVAEFGFPGPLRDRLVAAILAGTKTTATGLVADYEHEGEPLPRPGLREAVVDSAGHRVAVIETVAVQVIRLGDVDLAHAFGEGEGYTSMTSAFPGYPGGYGKGEDGGNPRRATPVGANIRGMATRKIQHEAIRTRVAG